MIDTTTLDGSAFSTEVIGAVRDVIAQIPSQYVARTQDDVVVKILAAKANHPAFPRPANGSPQAPGSKFWKDGHIYLNEGYPRSENIPAEYGYRFPAGVLPHAFVIAHELGHAIHDDRRYFPLFLRYQEEIWGIASSRVEAAWHGVLGQIQMVSNPTLRVAVALESWHEKTSGDRESYEPPILHREDHLAAGDDESMRSFFAETTTIGITEDFAECWMWHRLARRQFLVRRPKRATWFAAHFPD